MPPVFLFDSGYLFLCMSRPALWSNVQYKKKQRLSIENSTLLNLNLCGSFTPKFIFPVHGLIQSDVRGGTGNKEIYFYWFPAQVPFSFLLVNFLVVWEIRFFSTVHPQILTLQCLHFWTFETVPWKMVLVHKSKAGWDHCNWLHSMHTTFKANIC